MTPEQLITQRLEQLEAVMREHHLWQSTPPAEGRSRAVNPFARYAGAAAVAPVGVSPADACPDCGPTSVTTKFCRGPYYEVALVPDQPGIAPLLLTLRQLDALITDAAH